MTGLSVDTTPLCGKWQLATHSRSEPFPKGLFVRSPRFAFWKRDDEYGLKFSKRFIMLLIQDEQMPQKLVVHTTILLPCRIVGLYGKER